MTIKSLKKAIDSIITEEINHKLNEIGNFLKNENIELSPSEIDKAIFNFKNLNLNKEKEKKKRKQTAYQNFMRIKMPDYKNSGQNGRENLSLIAKEWMKLNVEEKNKYNTLQDETIKENKSTNKNKKKTKKSSEE